MINIYPISNLNLDLIPNSISNLNLNLNLNPTHTFKPFLFWIMLYITNIGPIDINLSAISNLQSKDDVTNMKGTSHLPTCIPLKSSSTSAIHLFFK